MENTSIMLFIFGAVAFGMLGQGWVSFLDHQRRRQTLDIIKTAIQAGKEPPPELYALLRKDDAPRAPWGEAFVFGVLALGFWLAFAFMGDERRMAFLVIAATMTVTSLGSIAFALLKSGRPHDDERP
jgi:hypothetical protein